MEVTWYDNLFPTQKIQEHRFDKKNRQGNLSLPIQHYSRIGLPDTLQITYRLKEEGVFKKKSLRHIPKAITSNEKTGCRGRIRTSTGQLAKAQSLVVNPGRPYQW
jgi:hypothetical protein